MSSFYGHGQVFESFASSGLTPFPAQMAIKQLAEIGGSVNEKSPFGQNPTPEVRFGFEACFQLEDVDDEFETFEATGFYDNAVVRRTQLGMPVPDKYTGLDAPVEFADEKLHFVGVFGPSVGETIHDTETKSVYHIYGTTDMVVHAAVKPYQPLVWRPATMKEIEFDAKNGSWLQRRNPGAPRIVPFDHRFIAGPISHTSRKFLSVATKADWGRIRQGNYGNEFIESLLNRVSVSSSNNGAKVSSYFGSKKQLKIMLAVFSDALHLSDELSNLVALPGESGEAVQKGIEGVMDRMVNLVSNVSDYHADRASHLVGTSLSRAPNGNTAHVLIGSGAM